MRRVFPSDVVKALESEFPHTLKLQNHAVNSENYRAHIILPSILNLIGDIPEELLLVIDSEASVRFTMALGALQAQLSQTGPGSAFGWPRLSDNSDCLGLLRDMLKQCRDEAPSVMSHGLSFIEDDDEFRNNLRIDLGSAEKALSGGEWKAAMVLSGSILEALLLWSIQQHEVEERALAMTRAVGAKTLTKPLQVNNLTAWEWNLHPYIELAVELGEIKERTARACREAKYYRNLIHPGAAERDSERCTRGKALGALGAVMSTVDDLQEKHPSCFID